MPLTLVAAAHPPVAVQMDPQQMMAMQAAYAGYGQAGMMPGAAMMAPMPGEGTPQLLVSHWCAVLPAPRCPALSTLLACSVQSPAAQLPAPAPPLLPVFTKCLLRLQCAGMVYPGAAAGGMPYGMMMQPYGYVPMRPGQVRTARAVADSCCCAPQKACRNAGGWKHTQGANWGQRTACHLPHCCRHTQVASPAGLLTESLYRPTPLVPQEAMMQAYAAGMQMAYAPYGSPGAAGMAMPVSPVSGMQNPLSPTGSGPLGRRPSGSGRYSGGRGGGSGQRSAAATPRADSTSQDRQQTPAAAAAAAVAAAQAAQQPAAQQQQPAQQQAAAAQQQQQQPQQQEQPSGA